MITVITGAGGVGKTTVVANLAVYFALRGYSTLAFDGNIKLPNLNYHFGIEAPQYSIHSLAANPTLSIEGAVYQHRSSGAHILAGDPSLGHITNISPSFLRSVLRKVRNKHPVIFIDCSSGIPLDDLKIFEMASYQIVVLEIERAPIKSLPMFLESEVQTFEALGLRFNIDTFVVLNKVQNLMKTTGSVVEYIEDNFGIPVIGIVPYDGAIVESIQFGEPVLTYLPRSKAANAFKSIGELLEGVFEERI